MTLNRLGRCVLLAVACALSSSAAPAASVEAKPRLRVELLDVGQGDAVLVTSPSGKRVLLDGGPREASHALVARVCPPGSGPLDLILLTHRHADHLGGLTAVVRSCGARLFMDAGFVHASPAYATLIKAVAAQQIPVRQAERGRQIDLGGGATLTLLTPPDPVIARSRSDVNSNSVVVRLVYDQVSVLFAADAEATTEKWLLGTGVDLRATALKVAHHGSAHSSTARFLQAVRPEVAVISVGAGNRYGHPAPATLRRLANVGARIYRTDKHGVITLETDGVTMEVRTP